MAQRLQLGLRVVLTLFLAQLFHIHLPLRDYVSILEQLRTRHVDQQPRDPLHRRRACVSHIHRSVVRMLSDGQTTIRIVHINLNRRASTAHGRERWARGMSEKT